MKTMLLLRIDLIHTRNIKEFKGAYGDKVKIDFALIATTIRHI